MLFKKTTIASLLAVSGLALSSGAFAQAKNTETGFYIGASVGQSTADCDTSGTTLSCDDTDTAYKVFGGYKFNKNLAVEAGYAPLGEVNASGGGVNITAEANVWDLVAVGMLPLGNNFSIFGKLGVYNGKVEVSSNVPGISGDKTTTDLTYGLGAQFDFTRNLGIRGEWQRYASAKTPSIAGSGEDKTDIDVLSLGVLWKF
jgi:OOP family OmpA-OmpF porin